jgi:hypothetical protein
MTLGNSEARDKSLQVTEVDEDLEIDEESADKVIGGFRDFKAKDVSMAHRNNMIHW